MVRDTLLNTDSNWWAVLNKLQQLWLGCSWISKQQYVDVSSTSQTVWKPVRRQQHHNAKSAMTPQS